jgi:NAD(P)-dependent dehydrogenase (short-subunit alcohol dehydrogenase family)
MKLTNRTILITGGSTGIGLALALKFIELGNEVIVTGRRQAVLDQVKATDFARDIVRNVLSPMLRDVALDNLRRLAVFVEREALGRLVLCRVSDFPGLAHAIAETPSELQLPGDPCRAIEIVAGMQTQIRPALRDA